MHYVKQMWMLLLIVSFTALLSGCKKDSEEKTTGTLKGLVTDSQSATPLANVRIIVFDANTNNPVGSSFLTGADGSYTIELPAGNYYFKLYKQGYNSIPSREMSAIPLNVTVNTVVDQPYHMSKSEVVNGGMISGKVSNGSSGVGGVLVVATAGANGYSSVTDKDGNYFIYNLPEGSFSVKGWLANYNSSEATCSVTANAEAAGVNVNLTEGGTSSVSGQVSFLATTNFEVDVTLIHPATREPIPGLSIMTTGGTYTIHQVPAGNYIARATYKNDTKVMDPDWIIKNGEPTVIVNGSNTTRNFSVTGAVELASPTNASTTVEPVLVTSTSPTFSWQPYSSTDDYIIEVTDANGNLLWGGFSNNYTVKNISIPKSQTSIQFNSDGTATQSLLPGSVYRWRVYASKNDIKEALGWKLISVSEDQRGLIKIQ